MKNGALMKVSFFGRNDKKQSIKEVSPCNLRKRFLQKLTDNELLIKAINVLP